MKKNIIIAIDIDDVLAVENDAVRLYANETYGHTHTADDYMQPGSYWGYWEQVQGVSKEEGAKRFLTYLHSGVKSKLQVMDGAVDAVNHLKKSYTLVIVTSRNAHLVDITHDWLNSHFPETFKDVAFVAVWTGSVKGSKADVCKELGAEYLIDDNPEHLQLAALAGIKGLLFGEYGWSNSVAVNPETIKVKNWAEVKAFFDAAK